METRGEAITCTVQVVNLSEVESYYTCSSHKTGLTTYQLYIVVLTSCIPAVTLNNNNNIQHQFHRKRII